MSLFGLTDTDNNYGFGNYSFMNPTSFESYYNQIKADQKAIWDREDSAMQRQVADMKKAGLNPWTAVSGNGAPTSSTNPTETAVSSLIQLLSLNNSAIKLKDSDEKWTVNTIIDSLMDVFKAGTKAFF